MAKVRGMGREERGRENYHTEARGIGQNGESSRAENRKKRRKEKK